MEECKFSGSDEDRIIMKWLAKTWSYHLKDKGVENVYLNFLNTRFKTIDNQVFLRTHSLKLKTKKIVAACWTVLVGNVVWLMGVIVHKDYRDKGLGELLVAKTMNCHKRGTGIRLSTDVDLEGFYNKLGFVKVDSNDKKDVITMETIAL